MLEFVCQQRPQASVKTMKKKERLGGTATLPATDHPFLSISELQLHFFEANHS